MKRSWWFSSPKMTVLVIEEREIIVDGAPVIKRFIGQHIKRLADWMRGQGEFRWARLKLE